MKKLSIIPVPVILWVLLSVVLSAGGCSEKEMPESAAEADEPRIKVSFLMDAIEMHTEFEQMTRAAVCREWFDNNCRLLILKKADSRWIVDATQTILLDPGSGQYAVLKLTDALPRTAFACELRPGEYRIVAVINWRAAVWNDALVPGTTVADEADSASQPLPLVTYQTSDHWMNLGYRMLNREMFVAVADFSVPKSEDLHSTGMPLVTLHAERRVGKFRILLKDKPSPANGFSFDPTAHTAKMVFRTEGNPFAEGIDALGGMYYGNPGLYELPWCMSTMSDFHASTNGSYQICQTNSTVFSPFLFADPTAERPFTVEEILITGASGGFMYQTSETFARTLAASRIVGIVFETTDTYDDSDLQILINVVEAEDEGGKPENAATLFDPFYEWNAMSY